MAGTAELVWVWKIRPPPTEEWNGCCCCCFCFQCLLIQWLVCLKDFKGFLALIFSSKSGKWRFSFLGMIYYSNVIIMVTITGKGDNPLMDAAVGWWIFGGFLPSCSGRWWDWSWYVYREGHPPVIQVEFAGELSCFFPSISAELWRFVQISPWCTKFLVRSKLLYEERKTI